MTGRQAVGPVLDGLGVEVALAEGQQVTEAVVILKVEDPTDGGTGLLITGSAGLDWIARRGLITGGLWLNDQAECVCDD